jgi:hypothetical protein
MVATHALDAGASGRLRQWVKALAGVTLAAAMGLWGGMPAQATPPSAAADDAPATPVLQAITVGVVPSHATETAIDPAGRVLVNHQDGSIFRIGYARTQTLTIWGIHDLVSELFASVGAGSPNYQGITLIHDGASEGLAQGPISYAEEHVNWRLGKQFTLSALPLALTPFVGVAEMGWMRDFSGNQLFSSYYQQSAEAGLAVKANLGQGWTLSGDASVGRTLGAVLLSGGNTPYAGLNDAHGQRFSIGIDRRWYDDWHQGLRIEQEQWRFPAQPTVTRLFEPLQRRDTAIMLVFSTERDLF